MEERIVNNERAPEAPVHTTTIVREGGGSGGGAMGIFMAAVLLVAVIGAIYLFGRQSESEANRNDAMAEAARNVGQAAGKVGSAAENAANNLKPKD